MAATQAQARDDSTSAETVVVHRSVDRSGATYALDWRTRERLRARYGADLNLPPRVFIAQESGADYERIHGGVRNLVAQVLTGLSPEQLRDFGPIEFIDPVTEERVG